MILFFNVLWKHVKEFGFNLMSIWYSKVHINLKCFQNDIIIVDLCYHIYTLTPYLKFECVNEVLPQLEIRKIMIL